jgi:formylmethanofuran dehydrogenase subunit E-like metal-binding protein
MTYFNTWPATAPGSPRHFDGSVVKNNDLLKNSDTCFVQGIQPWCKDDALMIMLNTTPGKTGYAVTCKGFPSGSELWRKN